MYQDYLAEQEALCRDDSMSPEGDPLEWPDENADLESKPEA
jgi:hypothetical protein